MTASLHGPGRVAVWAGALFVAVSALVLVPSTSASAHPLGNFTINHYHGLVLTPAGLTDHAVIDTAELPTLQQRDEVDVDADGTVSDLEAHAFAASSCEQLSTQVIASVGGVRVLWDVTSSSLTYGAGAAGLDVSRLECTLKAPVDLTADADIDFEDRYLSDRLGWREITATGDGIALTAPDVPAESVSEELRSYPNGLLGAPLDQRSVHLDAAPGISTDVGVEPTVAEPGWTSRLLESATGRLDDLVGSRDLTLKVGVIAIALCLLLGASHAALPGHGKTLMAAYMVGTRGAARDAVWIGTTVTLAHTAGVLVVGVLISASATFAGESLLSVLGAVSGLLVVGIGIALVRAAWRGRSLHGGHSHGHGHRHEHDHGHGLGHGLRHGHSHFDTDHHAHGPQVRPAHEHEAVGTNGAAHPVMGRIALQTRDLSEPDGATVSRANGLRRWTLVGMGIAGGLVPSPSALIVLLGAIALGRTAFGVLLVAAYGIGMAATLTTVGYLIAKVPRGLGRLGRATASPAFDRLSAVAPVMTATMVLIVGVGLATRSAAPLL